MTALLSERDVEREYDIPTRTQQGWRQRGVGPEFIKCGRSVRYRRDAVERWLTDNTRRSTSDLTADNTRPNDIIAVAKKAITWGKTEDEIRELVRELVAARANAAIIKKPSDDEIRALIAELQARAADREARP